ncbi:MAG: efflux RND transporter periplasmic adaptor subunit [Polymorphobacter sp.]
MNRRIILLVVLLIAVAAAFAVFRRSAAPPSAAGAAPPVPAASAAPPAGIRTATATPADTAPIATLPAVVNLPPNARVAVTTPFSGTVEQVFVIEGQAVARGQALASVVSRDALELAAGLARAQAQLGLARSSAARTAQLAREGIVAGARADEADAALHEAQINVAEKRRLLGIADADDQGRITLRAPISGRLAVVAAQAGAALDNATAPFVIDAVARYHLDIQLPERLAAQVRPGLRVLLPGGAVGRVLSVGSVINPATRAVMVKAAVPPVPGLVPGKTLMATLADTAPPAAVTIPAAAVTRIDGKDVVFVASASGFAPRPVTIAGSANGQTVVTGIAAGTRVATAGLSELKMLAAGS